MNRTALTSITDPAENSVAEYTRKRMIPIQKIRSVLPRFSRARAVFDDLLRILASHTPEPNEGYEAWGLPRIAYTAAFLRRYTRPGCRVMDLASGSHFSLLITQALPGVAWIPTDGERSLVEFQDRRTGKVTYRYDPIPLTLTPGRIDLAGGGPPDVVTLFEVLEHLPWNPAPLLGSVAERLALGGRLLVSTPNVCGRSPILRQLCGASPHQTPFLKEGLWYHKKEYSPWEMRLLFEWAGFEIETLHTANVYLSDPSGWGAAVHTVLVLAATALSASPVEARHLLWHSGSTMFVVGRKVRPPRWADPTPDV
jgi:2-polyprenyl-3-methyl-5-hydroxy-6-metoxy-1,4-benzoquinol methylase